MSSRRVESGFNGPVWVGEAENAPWLTRRDFLAIAAAVDVEAFDLLDDADDLPSADLNMLGPLKCSPEYGAIRWRVMDPRPRDGWRAVESNYFVFVMRPPDEAPDTPSFALFRMAWGSGAVLAVTVTHVAPDQVEFRHVRRPHDPVMVLLPRQSAD